MSITLRLFVVAGGEALRAMGLRGRTGVLSKCCVALCQSTYSSSREISGESSSPSLSGEGGAATGRCSTSPSLSLYTTLSPSLLFASESDEVPRPKSSSGESPSLPYSSQGLPFGDCLLLSALLNRPRKAAGYAVPTATAPLCGLLHCLPCVARLKEANNHQMADPVYDSVTSCMTFVALCPNGSFSILR